MSIHLQQRQLTLQDGDILPTPHHADHTGFVRISRDRVYRHIAPDCRDSALRLLTSPLFGELMERELFPSTTIVSDELAKNALVLEHEKAPFVLYPWEWSFSMLKDACLAILAAADVCDKHGHRLHDGFIQNIVFFSGQPRYVDLGGIAEKTAERQFTSRVFLEYGYLALKLWSEGNIFMAQCILREIHLSTRLRPRTIISTLPMFRPYVRPFFPQRRLVHRLKALLNMGLWQIPVFRSKLFALPNFNMPRFTNTHICTAIEALQRPARSSAEEQQNAASPTHERIIRMLAERSYKSIAIIGGGRGSFAALIARHIPHAQLLSLDYDSEATDDHYLAVRADSILKQRITTGFVNILYPNHRLLPLETRGRAELVVVRTPVHNLLFRQNADMTTLLDTLIAMSSAYLAIEFDLTDTQCVKKMAFPSWYTLDWFRNRLKPHFHAIREEALADDHVLFFCEKRPPAQV